MLNLPMKFWKRSSEAREYEISFPNLKEPDVYKKVLGHGEDQ